MERSYIQDILADRIGGREFGRGSKIYKFEKIKRAKALARKMHPAMELLDFGVGEPDEMAFPVVVEAMRIECAKPENRGYADNGIQELKDAAAKYMEDVFGVKGIDPVKEVIHSIGSKPALAMIPAAFINPGDKVLMTIPGYPVLGTHTHWYGGEILSLPLLEKNNFLPDIDAIPEDKLKRVKLLYLNYPNNPTGAGATVDFFKRVVEFAHRNRIVVVHDAAYAALTYNNKPLSFLSIDGAKDVGIELHSFSKAFNMTGWRLAFAVGNERVISAFAHVKDNFDSGQFIAIQKAGIYALQRPDITEKIAAKYKRRLGMMVDALNNAGFEARMPSGSFYIYVKSPAGKRDGRRFGSAEEAAECLITEELISSVPWDDAGHYLRFSATFNAKGEDEERRVVSEMEKRLSEMSLVF